MKHKNNLFENKIKLIFKKAYDNTNSVDELESTIFNSFKETLLSKKYINLCEETELKKLKKAKSFNEL